MGDVVAAAVIRDERGQVLLIREGYGRHRYGLPGGAVELDETPERAVVREVMEETGLSVAPVYRVCRYRAHTPEGAEFENHVFVCDVIAGSPAIPGSGEIEEIGWFDPDSCPSR